MNKCEIRWRNKDTGLIDELLVYNHNNELVAHLEDMGDGSFYINVGPHGFTLYSNNPEDLYLLQVW